MNDMIQSDDTVLPAVIPAASVPTILANDPDDILGKLSRKVAEHKPDISTVDGRKKIASLAAEVASSKMDLIRLGKKLTEGWRKSTSAVNAECKLIEERMDALKIKVRQPLTNFENIEKDRIAAHQAALAEIAGWATIPPEWTADQIAARIAQLDTDPLLTRNWQEFHGPAVEAVSAANDALKRYHAAAVRREAEAAELARLRAIEAEQQRVEALRLQAEREAAIAAEAAERAKRQAEAQAAAQAKAAAEKAEAERVLIEQRERDAIEQAAKAKAAAEKAEQDRAAEAARSKAAAEARERQVEAARVAAEQKAEREKAAAVEAERRRAAEAERQAAAEAERRAANVAHRRKINQDVLAALITCGLSDDLGKAVIVAVANGQVPHMRIEY